MNNPEIRPDYMYHYKKWHSDDPAHILKMRNVFSQLVSGHLPENRKSRVLEIGCGMGFAMLAVQDMGFQNIEGIDIDPCQIKSCKNKNLKVQLVGDTVSFLLENAGAYDVILGFDLIEHIPHKDQLDFMRAIYCALAPGGRFLCTVPNANSTVASRWRYIDWTHHISFTEISLDFLFHSAGFSKINISESGSLPAFPYSRIFSSDIFKTHFQKEIIFRIIRRGMRFLRRLELIGELGWEAKKVPLSPNLFGSAYK